MKTRLVLAVLMVLFVQSGYAQSDVNQLFKSFSKAKEVSHITLGEAGMKIAGLFTDMMGVEGIDILSLDGCSSSTKDDFTSEVNKLKDSDFEAIATASEGSTKTRVLARMNDELISELVVLTTGSNHSMVRIKGNIKPSDIESLIKKYKKD